MEADSLLRPDRATELKEWYDLYLSNPIAARTQLPRGFAMQIDHTQTWSGFCDTCSVIGDNLDTLWSNAKPVCVGTYTTTVLLAGRTGCNLCRLIAKSFYDNTLEELSRIEMRLNRLQIDSQSCLELAETDGRSARLTLLWPRHTEEAHENHTLVELAVYRRRQDVQRLSSIKTASSWLQACNQHHKCLENSTIRPTRLIDINDLRIINTSELPELPRYATLSYRWGEREFIKLVRSALSTFQVALPDELPQTIANAIQIARDLGLTYVWIDSLCIMQDDETDMQKEVAMMRSIYGGGYVNLAAVTDDAYAGITLDTNVKALQLGQFFLYDRDLYLTLVRSNVLNRRGWCYQERILSPRTIAFGARGVLWECRHSIQHECLPGVDMLESRCLTDRFFERTVLPSNIKLDWSKVVEHYSSTELSKAHDKLIALSGVARRQAEVIGDTYYAGLWKRAFVHDLAWSRIGEHASRTKIWRAPTWSWASIDGNVKCSDQTLPKTIDVINITTDPVNSDDPFGALKKHIEGHATLTLACGFLIQAEVVGPARLHRLHHEIRITDVFSVIASLDSPEDDFEQMPSEVFLLMLGFKRGTHPELLVLQATDVHGAFRRVGLVSWGWLNGMAAAQSAGTPPNILTIIERGKKTAANRCKRTRERQDSLTHIIDLI